MSHLGRSGTLLDPPFMSMTLFYTVFDYPVWDQPDVISPPSPAAPASAQPLSPSALGRDGLELPVRGREARCPSPWQPAEHQLAARGARLKARSQETGPWRIASRTQARVRRLAECSPPRMSLLPPSQHGGARGVGVGKGGG